MFLLVNFGGPRELDEVPLFLESLLLDRDVIRSQFPTPIHNWFFRRIARKRAIKVRHDYAQIGNKSPIYFDTEELAKQLSAKLNTPILTFHRYLPTTHADSLARIQAHKSLTVLPLFPQFSYATTGSLARLLAPYCPHWIKSYPTHPAYIFAMQTRIQTFLQENLLKEEETLLLFSAHGLPRRFIQEGDPYEQECNASYQAIRSFFPKAESLLCYQSKFGRGEWLRPYTDEVAAAHPTRRLNVVFIPMSFTSDHIETLFEIEKLYLPLIDARGKRAYRCPALNLEPYWIDALCTILQTPTTPGHALIRP